MNRKFDFDLESSIFNYYIEDLDPICTENYLSAIDNTIIKLYNEAYAFNLSKIALCLSGIDSELIANRMFELGISCEYFFLHIKTINDNHLRCVTEISKKHGVYLNVIDISIDDIFDYILDEIFNICPVWFPGYVVGGIITKFIPDDYYIIIGEGDLEKTDVNKYLTIYNNSKLNTNDDKITIPIHLSEIHYNKCMLNYNKKGESNFYSRDFNTWYHILKDSRLRTNHKFFYDTKSQIIFKDYFDQTIFRVKTDNFERPITKDLASKIFSYLRPKIPNKWSPYIGTLIQIPKNIL